MKQIVIRAFGNENWIGGLYYVRNITFQLMQNRSIAPRLVVFVNKKNEALFSFAKDKVRVLRCKGHTKKENDVELLMYVLTHRDSCIYPGPRLESIPDFIKKKLGIMPIMWIPDFQDSYYPEMFEKSHLQDRRNEFEFKAQSRYPLILSSYDCFSDFCKYYSTDKNNVYIMPFVSYIEDLIPKTKLVEDKILRKYEMRSRRYACIMNQFWQHKNHLTILEALKLLVNRHLDVEFLFLFTGQLKDNRNPEYIERLKILFQNPTIKPYVRLLGFISREEQICLMKNAEFVIQPSLFEGWGTVVEDAKVLDKTILLSDIPVHREQMNEKCILFNPHNPVALADLIEDEMQKEHHDNIEKGIADMYMRAKEYTKGFEQLLKDLERK